MFRNCIVDRNRIWRAKDGVLINDGGAKKYKTLDEVRKEFEWELHGEVLPYDKDKDTVESVVKAMGGSVVTFRIPWGKHSGDARPMLANAQINARWPGGRALHRHRQRALLLLARRRRQLRAAVRVVQRASSRTSAG